MPWSIRQPANEMDLHEIESRYGSLATGVSVGGELCPACEGGRTKEKSLSVTRTATGILYKCHRASCSTSGVVTFNGAKAVFTPRTQRPSRAVGRARYHAIAAEPLPAHVVTYIEARYGIGDFLRAKGLLRWSEAHSPSGHGRLILPTIDHLGYPYGYTARKLDNQEGPKTLTYAENLEGSWYKNVSSHKLVIVEDQLSAIKASQFVNTVALLGTNITDATLKAIKAGQYTSIYLALDRDAFPRAVKMAVELRPQVTLSLLRLQKDLKDMTVKEIVELFAAEGVIPKPIVVN